VKNVKQVIRNLEWETSIALLLSSRKFWDSNKCLGTGYTDFRFLEVFLDPSSQIEDSTWN
jgi:hypothetical protein